MLDVGCGKGYMAFKLAPFLGDTANIYGIDSEPNWIREANNRTQLYTNNLDKEFIFKVGDSYDLPFESNLMDLTVCQTLLIHLSTPEKAIAEMIRVTKPGHNIIAFEPNNRINSLIMNNLNEIDEKYETVMRKVDSALRVELGKKSINEGLNSLGDIIHEFFYRAGFKNVRVWISDKAATLIPSYDTEEKQAIRDEIIHWMEYNEANYDYDKNLKYYLAGGGKECDFLLFWQEQEQRKQRDLSLLREGRYISSGGVLFYIIVGTK